MIRVMKPADCWGGCDDTPGAGFDNRSLYVSKPKFDPELEVEDDDVSEEADAFMMADIDEDTFDLDNEDDLDDDDFDEEPDDEDEIDDDFD